MHASTCFRYAARLAPALALWLALTSGARGQQESSVGSVGEGLTPQGGVVGGGERGAKPDADTKGQPQAGAFESRYEWFQTLIPPRMAADMFGRRIARNYIAIQVTVENNHQELDLIVYDVEVDYSWLLKKFCKEDGEERVRTSQGQVLRFLCESSSQELSILRGVAEKGQINDPRNNILRILSGLGTIASALPGVIVFTGASSFPTAVAAFNGAGLTAYRQTFPDFTVNQLNRLNDAAYTANTVVKTKNSRVFVAFIPLDLFLSKNERKQYWKNPHKFFGEKKTDASTTGDKTIDLRKLQIIISAEHVVPRDEVQPLITNVQIDQKQMENLTTKVPVEGYIVGRFLDGRNPVIGDADNLGMKIEIDKKRQSTDNRVFFVITPSKIPKRGQAVSFQAVRGDYKSNTHSKVLTHVFPPPTFTSITPTEGSAGPPVNVKVSGTNLFEGHVTLVDNQAQEIKGVTMKAKPTPDACKDGSCFEATLTIAADAEKKEHEIRVSVDGTLSPQVKKFTIE